MTSMLQPHDEHDVLSAVQDAVASQTPLRVRGFDSKSGFGGVVNANTTLSTQGLSGITLYEPAELVVSARAGTPLRTIVDLLNQHGQELAFEPMDHALFLGGAPGDGSVAGMVAVNASGPRRIKAGAARDHLLGFRCVTGRGEVVKSGGRVMKNVTGYDLSKLVAGSYGTLCVLTEVTLKVLPKAETEITLLASGLDEAASLRMLRQASGTPHEVSSFAVLPPHHAPLHFSTHVAALRLEGPSVSVLKRRDDLVAFFKSTGAIFATISEDASRALWRSLRDAEPVRAASGLIWRVSVAPSAGGEFMAALRTHNLPIQAYFFDWAGGLVWLALDTDRDADAGTIRACVDALGGHATLVRAPEDVRARVPVFHPQPTGLAALSARVKDSFDPLHLLERGRMRADI